MIRVTYVSYISELETESSTTALSTPFHRAHHRFLLFTACCTFFLLIAGALVTSNDAGLSVPDWPTSYGSLYRLPPMKGGVLFEHGHRMVAELIGLLTIGVAVWTQKVDKRAWMRLLGWAALGTVIAQGMLGGLTVYFQLPAAVSTAHATLAQTFFCIIVSMALFTSRSWLEDSNGVTTDSSLASLATRSYVAVACIWTQLILGAAFRHSGLKLIPHLIGACVVTAMILWTAIPMVKRCRHIRAVRVPATALLSLLGVQLLLGLASYLTRVVWNASSAEPQLAMVIATVSHVAVGALVLATSVVLALGANRHLASADATELAAGRTATA